MARPEKCRRISSPPMMKGFRPYGIPHCKIESVQLSFEEYESFKLVAYENLQQEYAAKQMNISRPTLTRIYNKALKKVSQAFVEGKAIEIEGGNYIFDRQWYRCNKCNKIIQGKKNHIKCTNCKEYSNSELISLNK